MRAAWALASTLAVLGAGMPLAAAQVAPVRTLRPAGLADIDDSVFWIHPTDPTRSTIILADKVARRIFVMRPDGTVLQTITTAATGQGPGNIDLRYGFPLGGSPADLVVTTNRATDQLDVFRVEPATGMLEQVDDGTIDVVHAAPVYGIGLYRSPITGALHAIVTQNGTGAMEQIELYDDQGTIRGRQVRTWTVSSLVEGVVADDENGRVFFAEEDVGVWSMDGEPGAARPGTAVTGLQVGDNDLVDDLEGVTLYRHGDGTGYLLVSSQGNSTYKVFERLAPHAFVGSFSITNTGETDGIDVTPLAIGAEFAEGAFTAHNGLSAPYPTELVGWAEIRAAVPGIVAPPAPGWDPRDPGPAGDGAPGGADAGADPNLDGSGAGCGCGVPRNGVDGAPGMLAIVGGLLVATRRRASRPKRGRG